MNLDHQIKIAQHHFDPDTDREVLKKDIMNAVMHSEEAPLSADPFRGIRHKKLLLLVFLIAAVFLVSTSIYADGKVSIHDLFNQIKIKQDQQKQAVLVQGDGFQIDAKQFVFYKSNLEMIAQLENQPKIVLSDDQIIDNLIIEELTAQYAKQQGITASAQEISDEISKERAALHDPKNVDPKNGNTKNKIVFEIMKNRIRITGLTEDQFWQSAEIRGSYERAILIGKLYVKLQSEGKIKSMQDFQTFKSNLLEQNRSKVKIYKDTIR